MHIIVARFQVKADCRQAFQQASIDIISGTRAESGCIFYALHEDAHESGTYLFYEEWADRHAIDQHFVEPHFRAFGEAIADLIEGPPQVTIHEVAHSETPAD